MTDPEVISQMVNENKNIQMSVTFVEAKSCKQGGLITFGISAEALHKIVLEPNDYILCAFIIDRKQFLEIKYPEGIPEKNEVKPK